MFKRKKDQNEIPMPLPPTETVRANLSKDKPSSQITKSEQDDTTRSDVESMLTFYEEQYFPDGVFKTETLKQLNEIRLVLNEILAEMRKN